jgi:hypothetical protein
VRSSQKAGANSACAARQPSRAQSERPDGFAAAIGPTALAAAEDEDVERSLCSLSLIALRSSLVGC